MTWPSVKIRALALVIALLVVWLAVHVPSLKYGTQNVPMTSSYVSDEMPGVLGALHVAAARSLFGLRNQPSVYYGPVYSALLLPAVLVDYVVRYATGSVHGPSDYATACLLDWGPLLFDARVISALVGFIGLVFMWLLLGTATLNPTRRRWPQVLGVAVLATNYFYFAYSGWARHWIFDTVLCLAQVYYAIRIWERPARRSWLGFLAAGALGFGVSYFPVVFQASLLPAIVVWIRRRDHAVLKALAWYALVFLALLGLVIFWNSLPFSWIFTSAQGTQYLIGASRLASFGYFLSVLIVDHPFLATAFVVALFGLALRRRLWRIENLIVLLPAAVYFAFFSLSWHPEPRYLMPVIAALVVFCLSAVAQLHGVSKVFVTSIVVLLALEVLVQTVTLVRWSAIVSRGPAEARAIAVLKSLEPGQRILVDGPDLLPTLQTPETLKNYVKDCHGGVTGNTIRSLENAVTPAMDPLQVAYDCGGVTAGDYDVILRRVSGEPVTVNFFEEDLGRLWDYGLFGRAYLIGGPGRPPLILR